MALGKLHAILEAKSQNVLSEHFSSYGGWKGILIKCGHPKPGEIQAAAQWAKQLTQT